MLLNSGALICNMFGWITYSVNLGSENEISDGQGKGAITVRRARKRGNTLRQVRERGYYCQTGKEKGQLLSDGQEKGAVTVRRARKKGNYFV